MPHETLTAGARLGPYAIVASLGAGGMGEVYRAVDTVLGRQVAIKILPPAFAADPERLARFEREAKTLAALNHPHIAAIYGFERSEAVHALVMEFVEGDDLSTRIRRGPLPLDDALPIAAQIAEALEAAHEQGIVHRDLKPANIKVRPDGTVKVLDFGLAKTHDGPPPGAATDEAATVTSPAITMIGMVVGTAAYMAPEQARGLPADRRADLWALGTVLWEMLTGRRLFEGPTVSDTLASVLKSEPHWNALPAETPAPIRRLLRRCLEKDRKRRLADAADARLEIEDALSSADAATGGAGQAPVVGRGVLKGALAVTAVAAALLAGPAMTHLREAAPAPLPETRTEIVKPSAEDPDSFALSPDGTHIVFAASSDGGSPLWLRALGTTGAERLAGTEGASYPFWSPDGRSLAFFAGGSLKRLDLGGGAPRVLAPAPIGRGGAWHPDGVILFTRSGTAPLATVPAAGGDVSALTTLARGQTTHRWPQAVPGGRFLFYAGGAPDTSGVYLGTLAGGSAPVRLFASDSAAVFLAPDWLLWVRGGALVAQRIDLASGALVGEPVTMAPGVQAGAALGQAPVSVAASGLVAYRTGPAGQRQLTWLDRAGGAQGVFGDPDGNGLLHPDVSPDGRRVAVTRTVQGNVDTWLLDGIRATRFTFDPGSEIFPLWSADGSRIVFSSNRGGRFALFQKPTNGAGGESRLDTGDLPAFATSWSPDGRYLMYVSTDPGTRDDLWIVAMSGAGAPAVFLKTPAGESGGVFSPDGRWVAYQSNETGRYEIYLRPFVAPGGPGASGAQWQVSTTGGTIPAWRPDGRELYFLDPAGSIMAAPIAVKGTALEPGAPVRVSETHIVGGGAGASVGRQYDVAPDGRFLINTVRDGTAAPVTLLQHWRPPTP